MLAGSDVYYRRNEWDEHKKKAEHIKVEDEDEATSLLIEDDEDEATSLLIEDDEDEATSLLIEDDEDEATSLLIEDDEDEATSLLIEDDEDEATSLLIEDDATALLDEQHIPKTYPYLIKKSSFDRIDINKPVFRIGKEKSYADYSVMNNNAVSRLHADIIEHNGAYFIKDNNSTNGTFVNGNRIKSNEEFEIFDGDSITLANENFDFHIN